MNLKGYGRKRPLLSTGCSEKRKSSWCRDTAHPFLYTTDHDYYPGNKIK
jgi:hypothetical protein